MNSVGLSPDDASDKLKWRRCKVADPERRCNARKEMESERLAIDLLLCVFNYFNRFRTCSVYKYTVKHIQKCGACKFHRRYHINKLFNCTYKEQLAKEGDNYFASLRAKRNEFLAVLSLHLNFST